MKILTSSTSIVFIAIFSLLHGSAEIAAPQQPVDYVMSEHVYKSVAIIQPRMHLNLLHKMKGLPRPPEFFKRQKDEILSDINIAEAILELIPDDVGDQEAFFDQVKNGIKAEFLIGTDLMEITVASGDKQFSRDLANRLAERYLKNHSAEEAGKRPAIHQRAELGTLVEKMK